MNHINSTRRHAAQATTEYLVMVGLIAIPLMAAVGTFGDELKRAFGHAASRLSHPPTLQLAYVAGVRRPPLRSSRRGAESLAGSTSMVIDGSLGKVKLGWDAPTTNVNGSVLNDLAGYRIYYGTEPGTYGSPVDVGLVTEFQVTGLEIGRTYYLAISAYDESGNESGLSDEMSKVAGPE